jgi:signal transduction histidine kinase/CheY-like chemotaxis protein/HAMP domain-containing protein
VLIMTRFWTFQKLQARTRLLLAFIILTVSATGLAVVGWLGLTNTGRALSEFEREALPNISRSLALAERTANLAAVAPYVANTTSPSMLKSLNNTLEDKIQTVLAMAKDIPDLDKAAPQLRTLLSRLDTTISELIDLTREHLLLKEDLRQIDYRLDLLKERIREGRMTEDLAPATITRLLLMLDQLSSASEQPDMDRLSLLQSTFAHALDQMGEEATFDLSPLPSQLAPLLSEFQAIGVSPRNVYELRRDQLALQHRRAFLLASTRAISEQLSAEVKRFVDRVQEQTAQQSDRVGLAVQSGKTGMLIIAILCLMAALGGIWVVRELSHQLGQVTSVMTRLAEGEKSLPMPAIERSDEIGALARAFAVFRNNAVEIDRISHNLKEQSRLLETIFDNMNDGLSVFDAHNRLVAWNPQYVSLLELQESDIHKGMTMETIHSLLSLEAQDSWALDGMALDRDEVNQRRKVQTQRFERRFPNGRVVEFRSNPMPDGGFVTLYSDLTERKTIEAQLRQSQKMEVLGQLTGGVAHDFNNLLAAIFGNLQLLEDTLDHQGKAFKYAQRALSASERGKALTQRLLAFSRKQHLQPEVTDVDGLIEGMMDLVEYSIDPSITLDLALDANHAWVSVDPGQLENALLNLAINSSAAMQSGGSLRFKTEALPSYPLNGVITDVVCIHVCDTGCGIPETLLRRVLEPFFTTKQIGEGSGLGLSMVYGFVKQSQGDIKIHSTEGQGTEIQVLLPTVAAPDQTQSEPRLSGEQLKGHGETILLVEDDPQVRLSAEALLDSLGYRVIATGHPDEALAAFKDQHPIDLIFTDINLGNAMNGVELADAAHQIDLSIPVLFTSGLQQQQLIQQYGIADQRILAKPYTREALAQMLSATLPPPQGAIT